MQLHAKFGDHDTSVIELKLSSLSLIVEQARRALSMGICINEFHKVELNERLLEFESFLKRNQDLEEEIA